MSPSLRTRISLGAAIALALLLWYASSVERESLPIVNGAEEADRSAWTHGPSTSEDFFPIAVWLQAPRKAPQYKAIGINLYLGLWKGPTEEQLATLEEHGMPVICDPNEFGLSQRDRKIIVGWMHGDEPDNAQSLGEGRGYGPPIAPERIIADYRRIKSIDPTRPVLLNLGQGVAWDRWRGRGVRTNHPEDYAEYAQGADILSFDIYPSVHPHEDVAGKLWYVPRGVKRLREWSGGAKIVWNYVECTRVQNPEKKPAPDEVKAEVWMGLVHGSQGIIYFAHQFKPRFVEAALLADTEMAEAVGKINRQVQALAPALNSPTVDGVLEVSCKPSDISRELAEKLGPDPVATMVKRHGGWFYIFAVRMEPAKTAATFALKGLPAKSEVEVIGEDRKIAAAKGRFTDDFGPHGVHLYRVRADSESSR